MKIIIASENPVKINATLAGFEKMFPDIEIDHESVTVSSDVSNQPLSDSETFTGAKNRAENAQKTRPDAEFWIGIEGGIAFNNENIESFAWIYIMRNDGKIGKAKSGTFMLSEKVRPLLEQGKELGDIDDMLFHQENSKQKQGTIGTLTNNAIDRTDYYREAVIMALIPFINENLY